MIAVLLSTNFIIAYKIFHLTGLFSLITSFTAILTPSLYPTDQAIHISLLGRFHILNSVALTAVIVVAAFATNSVTQDDLVWTTKNVGFPNNSDIAAVATNVSDQLALTRLNISEPLSCPPVPSETPILLTYGVLPPILVASLAYIFVVVVIMGLVRPAFLELPTSQQCSQQKSSKINKGPNIRGNGVVFDESEEQIWLKREKADVEEVPMNEKDKRKSHVVFEADFQEFSKGKETEII